MVYRPMSTEEFDASLTALLNEAPSQLTSDFTAIIRYGYVLAEPVR